MSRPTITCFDPSFRFTAGVRFVHDGTTWIPANWSIKTTVGIPAKERRVYAVTDDVRRLRELADWLKLEIAGSQMVVIEQVVGSGKGKAPVTLAYVTGVFAAMEVMFPEIPFVWIPQNLSKKAVMGRQKGVGKDEVVEWARAKYPALYRDFMAAYRPKTTAKKAQVPTKDWTDQFEHVADAVMVFHAAHITAEFKMLERLANEAEGKQHDQVRRTRRRPIGHDNHSGGDAGGSAAGKRSGFIRRLGGQRQQ